MNDFLVPLAVGAGLLVGAGLFVGVLAIVGLPQRAAGKPRRARRNEADARRRVNRIILGVVVGLLVLIAVRWVVAAVGVGLLVAFWDKIAGGEAEQRVGIAKLEALASWTESLRDTIAGAVGLEQAIPATAANAGVSIKPSLNLLVDRLRIREPLPNALLAFGDDMNDASADVVCAALVLNSRLRGPGLRDVLTALAVSAREELDMRRTVEAERRSTRRSVRIVLLIILTVMGGLSFLNPTYVAPYGTVTGQAVMLLVALLLFVGLWWLRALSSPRRTGRFLVAATNYEPEVSDA